MPVKISAVIPTYNRSALLVKAVESVFNQTISPELYQVIVVDNASTDDTKDICRRFNSFSNFRYIYEEKNGLSAARTRGIHAADGKYVAFTDDDAVVSPGWLEKLLSGFEAVTPKPGAVGGKIFPVWEVPVPTWLPRSRWAYLTVLDYGDDPMFIQYPRILYGSNMAFDKNLLIGNADFRQDLGRNRNKLIGGEDSWIFKKFHERSIPVYYLPEASVSHFISKRRVTKNWLYRRHYWQGRTEILLLGEEINKEDILKMRNDSFIQTMRILKSLLKKNTSDKRFSLLGDLLKGCGRLVQLRLIAKQRQEAGGKKN